MKCHEPTELICPSAPTWHLGIHLRASFFVVLRLDAYLSHFPVKKPAAPPAEPGMFCAKLMPGVSVSMKERFFSSSILLQAMPFILSILEIFHPVLLG